MPKLKKPDSRKISQKKLRKIEQKRKENERLQKLIEEEAHYTRPTERSEIGIEVCKQRVKDGKICYCKEKCGCRNCQERQKENEGHACSLEELKVEGGGAFGCSECSECNPCY